jgi:hypothetical protein
LGIVVTVEGLLRAPQKKEPGFGSSTRRWEESRYEGLKVWMPKIEFTLSSSGWMCNEDSSTFPAQKKAAPLTPQFFLLNGEVVLEPMSRHSGVMTWEGKTINPLS